MKKSFLFIFLVTSFSASGQTYTIDSTAFSALSLDGGNVEVEFADVNLDGHPDMITTGDHGSPNINTNQHGITVFFGNGTGAGWSLFQNGNFGYGGIAVGDVNNDSMPDVAYGIHHNYSTNDFGDQLLEAALGDGTGMNWTPWDNNLATAGETYGMMGTDLGDVDNDGWLDIASNSFGCCAGVHVYRNTGNGSWTHTFGFINGNVMHYTELGDINHDGNLDLAVCHQYGAAYFGNGTGNFVLKHLNLPSTGNFGFYDVSLDDIDNDGDDDFAFVAGGNLYVYKWNETLQTWINSSSGLSGTNYFNSRLADVNMDGFSDLVSINSGGHLKVWIGNGGSLWTNTLTVPLPNLSSGRDVAIKDIDHNGFPDIITWATYQVSTFTTINKLKLFRETSAATSLNIIPLYPKNYECIPNGAVRFIKWASAVPANHPSSVQIDFSSTGSSGPWTTAAANAPNNGVYQWTFPSAIASSNCYLRFIVTDSTSLLTDTAVTANPFQVGLCNPTLGIAYAGAGNDLAVAPNPMNNHATVFSSLKNAVLFIRDMRGTQLNMFEVEKFPFTISRNRLSSGMYMLEVQGRDGITHRAKLVVESNTAWH